MSITAGVEQSFLVFLLLLFLSLFLSCLFVVGAGPD